ncbi:MAG: MoaD/ThiS family protein [Anaerolineales bacterium]
MVKLILRDKEYQIKPGMTLLSALHKSDIVPESVIATRDGEMILEDEILKDGDVIRLIAVISGGSCHCEERSNPRLNQEIAHLHCTERSAVQVSSQKNAPRHDR